MELNWIKSALKKNKAFQDLVILTILGSLAYILAFIIKPFENLVEWSSRHANWHLDEFLIILAISSAVFSWRRWQEIKREIAERRQTEETFQATYAHLQAVVQASPLAILAIDPEGRVTLWNPAGERIFGWKTAETLGRPNPIVPQDKQEEFRFLRERVLRGESITNLELRRQKKDGSLIDISLSTAPIYDLTASANPKTVVGTMSVIADITEQKRAEEILRDSKERYRHLFENNPQPMWVYDHETLAFLAVNDAAVQHYGYSRDEFLSMTIKDIRPLEDIPELLERVAKRPPGIFAEGKRRYRKKDGTIIFVETSSSGILFGQRPARLVLAKDITERQRAEEALRESEERLRLLFQHSPVGIFHYDMQLCLTDLNDYFVNILQTNRKKLLGFNMNRLKDQSVLPAIKRAVAGEEGFYEGFYRATNSSAEVWISMRTAPLYDHQGKIKGGVGIVEDISKRKHLEAQLRQSQKMEAVGTLAGGVAHDFNNLLTAIILNLHSAKSKIREGYAAEPNLEEIESIAQRAVQLIRQLLAFSRRQLIQPVPLNLNNVITNISEMLSRLLHEHIELDFQLEGKLGTVKADASQMEQVVINLCVNARDAMPKGGKLILKTHNITLDEDYVAKRPWAQKGDYVLLEVADTGTGMDEVTLSRVFEPFFTTKEAGEGTGLGLSTVYGIIRQHQGYIDVYSQPELGTSFKIYLPRSEDKLESETASETTVIVGGNETILVAEDEEPLREAIQQILEMYGYTVLVARDGQEAVNLYEKEKERIDLVVLDVVMPRMGGKEVADWIYKQDPRQKILFSSGYSPEGLHESFVVPREMHFIQKPYNAGALAQKIREVLEGDA